VSRFVGAGLRPTRRSALALGAIGLLTVAAGGGAGLVSFGVLALVVAAVADAIYVTRRDPMTERTLPSWLPLLSSGALNVRVHETRETHVAQLRQPVLPALRAEPDHTDEAELASLLTGRHRGRHLLGPPVSRLRGPLGLVTRDYAPPLSDDIVVIPNLPRARRLADSRRRGGGDDGRARNRVGLGTEFESVRDYSPDDDVRQVNWVATAHVGRPMSNVYRVEENRDVVCVVDAGRPMTSPVGDLTRLDIALEAVTILCVEAEAAQDRVGTIAFADTILRRVSPRRRGARAVVDALFDLEPSEVESDYERAFVAVGRHKRALVVVFSDLVDENASRSLLEASVVLARRHSVMVATCRDGDLVAATSHNPVTVRDAFRSSVAVELMTAKDRVVSRLRRLGVSVVEAPAEQLGSACVREYLRLKSRGRA
jgi:uncharacterized protein (DUF58 family)